MKKILILIFILPTIFIFTRCETEFDIIADYEEITIVFGLLNQNDSITYLKINKAFLGEGNALVWAKNPDSSSYGNSLDVKMEEWKNENIYRTFEFETADIHDKDSGLFYYPDQVLYKSITYGDFSEKSIFKLKILNTESGKEITSESPLVEDFRITKPPYNHPTKPTINFPDNEFLKDIEWESAKNGKRYQVIQRFNYAEIFNDNPDTLFKYIDLTFPSKKSDDTDGGDEMQIQFANESFYIWCQNDIPYDPEKENRIGSRVAGKVEYIFSVAGDDFNTYMEVNEPSSSIIQERPEYTNIINGIGLFSCRYNKMRSYYLHPISEEILSTKGLGFVVVIGE